jgi:hypothetical protein
MAKPKSDRVTPRTSRDPHASTDLVARLLPGGPTVIVFALAEGPMVVRFNDRVTALEVLRIVHERTETLEVSAHRRGQSKRARKMLEAYHSSADLKRAQEKTTKRIAGKSSPKTRTKAKTGSSIPAVTRKAPNATIQKPVKRSPPESP